MNLGQHPALFLPPFLYGSFYASLTKSQGCFVFYIAIMLLDHEMSPSPAWCFTSPQGQRCLGRGLTLCCHILGLPVPNNNTYSQLKMTVTASLHARVYPATGQRERDDLFENTYNDHRIHVQNYGLLFFNFYFGHGLTVHHILFKSEII